MKASENFFKDNPNLPKILLGFVIIVSLATRLFWLYLPFGVYKYLVPPGDDAVSHYNIIHQILQGHHSSAYPTLFHRLTIIFSQIFNVDVMTALRLVTPALVVLPAIAVYFFAKKHFGLIPALFCALLLLWTGNYPLTSFADGNYPNILASGFFLPLALMELVTALRRNSLPAYLTALALALLVVITHHLSIALMLLIIIPYLLILAVWNRFERLVLRLKIALLICFLSLGMIAGLIWLLPTRTMFEESWKLFTTTGSFYSEGGISILADYVEYPAQIGGLLFYGGLLGAFVLILLLGRSKESVNKPAILLILTWLTVTFIASRLSSLGLPGRFLREMGIPLALSLGLACYYLLFSMRSKVQIFLGTALFALVIYTNLVQVTSGAYRSPNFFNAAVWFTQEDKEKADVIKGLTAPGDIIIANPVTPYLPIFIEREIDFDAWRSISVESLALGLRFDNQADAAAWWSETAEKQLEEVAGTRGAKYVFVGTKTKAGPSGKAYPFFAHFDEATKDLSLATQGKKPLYKFRDGSALYKI